MPAVRNRRSPKQPRRVSHDGGEPVRTSDGTTDFGPLLRRIAKRRARWSHTRLGRPADASVAWPAPQSKTSLHYIVLVLSHANQQPARFCFPLDDVAPDQLVWFAAWDNWTLYLSSDDPDERAVCESAASFILNSPLIQPDGALVVLESHLTLL